MKTKLFGLLCTCCLIFASSCQKDQKELESLAGTK